MTRLLALVNEMTFDPIDLQRAYTDANE